MDRRAAAWSASVLTERAREAEVSTVGSRSAARWAVAVAHSMSSELVTQSWRGGSTVRCRKDIQGLGIESQIEIVVRVVALSRVSSGYNDRYN